MVISRCAGQGRDAGRVFSPSCQSFANHAKLLPNRIVRGVSMPANLAIYKYIWLYGYTLCGTRLRRSPDLPLLLSDNFANPAELSPAHNLVFAINGYTDIWSYNVTQPAAMLLARAFSPLCHNFTNHAGLLGQSHYARGLDARKFGHL